MGKRTYVKEITIPWIEVSEVELFLVEQYLNGYDLLQGWIFGIDEELELIRVLDNLLPDKDGGDVNIIPNGKNSMIVMVRK